MDSGTKFAHKLEPFLLMSKGAKGAAAAKLIQDATSSPGVFVFAELLEQPNIQELANNEQHSQFLSLLQLFSYKSYQDYIQFQDSLPSLNQAQITKLKQLSLVTLAMDHRILPYAELLRVLDMPTIRELEDLIIDAMYLDIVTGKLDQREQQFEVEYTMGRDLEPGKLEQLLASLQNWASTTAAVLATLEEKLVQIANTNATSKTVRDAYDKQYQVTLKEILDKQKEQRNDRKQTSSYTPGKTTITAAGYAEMERVKRETQARENQKDSMDVDDPADGQKGKNRKPPSDGALAKQRPGKRNKT